MARSGEDSYMETNVHYDTFNNDTVISNPVYLFFFYEIFIRARPSNGDIARRSSLGAFSKARPATQHDCGSWQAVTKPGPEALVYLGKAGSYVN